MSSGHQRVKWRRNIAENFNCLSRVHEGHRQTDDRQTDGRTTTYSKHEDEFAFAKKEVYQQNLKPSDYLKHLVCQLIADSGRPQLRCDFAPLTPTSSLVFRTLWTFIRCFIFSPLWKL